ncbi:unnamed protein product [Brassicogethes aeneus]|uniref:Uncharacterized protein n=1 Tax=Brassicogethes aeneus TaxID=1431903 RepID=A0A9P0BAY5_BRAAE|nr:unnamed protein product [Brassicogethes aeneus]
MLGWVVSVVVDNAGTLTAGVVGAGVAIAAGPAIVSAVGFTAAGIAAKSTAAMMMSCSGGATAAGGVVATLQSVGATGSILGSGVTTAIGGSIGAATGAYINTLFEK